MCTETSINAFLLKIVSFFFIVFQNNCFVKPDEDKVSSVIIMKFLQNVSDLRRFLGMGNKLGKFLPNLATVTEPLRGLLSAQTCWYWDQPQKQAFMKIKQMLSSSPVLSL